MIDWLKGIFWDYAEFYLGWTSGVTIYWVSVEIEHFWFNAGIVLVISIIAGAGLGFIRWQKRVKNGA